MKIKSKKALRDAIKFIEAANKKVAVVTWVFDCATWGQNETSDLGRTLNDVADSLTTARQEIQKILDKFPVRIGNTFPKRKVG